jgi:hypothetical protein
MRILLSSLIAVAALWASEVKLGQPLALKETTPIETLAANPQTYVGKTVQAKGKVVAVCQMMGCWMNLADEKGRTIRIKVNDGEIVFPKDAAGKTAIAEGRFTKIELSKEQAVARMKHEAGESGRKFDPASVTGPVVIYQISGRGAVILD